MKAPPAEKASDAPSEPTNREKSFLPTNGRIGRLAYIFLVLFFLVWGGLGMLALAQLPRAETRFETVVLLLISIVTLPLAAAHIAAFGMQRLHDLDRSGWYLLLFIVPLVNIGLLLLLCLKGSPSVPNRYGERDSGMP